MPFVANTPESLLARADSKNAASTCRGITASGRPCRRPVAPATASSLRPRTPDPRDENLYCWQHKEQASKSAQSSPGPRGTATPILEGRSSIDTLADRLGLVDLTDKQGKQPRRRNGGRRSDGSSSGYDKPPKTTRPKASKQLSFCFCFSVPIEESSSSQPPRPQPRPVQKTSASMPSPRRESKQNLGPTSSRQRLSSSAAAAAAAAAAASPGKSSYRSRKSTASHTAQIKDLIPDTLDAVTASALMAELSRPYVDSEEPGFIYMFWLTPLTSDPAPVDAARSLLAPPPSHAGGGATRSRRASDVVSRFADDNTKTKTSSKKGSARPAMMLKIGRAANVQRRMNQWQRQCGYDVEMLRYYPYLPGSSESSGAVPHMTPHCHRVERLIHIELAGMGLRANLDKCGACGRDHREWFEIEANREGVGRVDEVVRRWIEWDERSSGH